MNAGTLHDAIDDVCPIIGVYVGKPDVRSTWSYEAKPEATQAQKQAADNVIATIPIENVGFRSTFEFVGLFTDTEYGILQSKRTLGAVAKLWDLVVCMDIVNMDKAYVKDLKAALVTNGVLTQARADVIFSGSPVVSLKKMK